MVGAIALLSIALGCASRESPPHRVGAADSTAETAGKPTKILSQPLGAHVPRSGFLWGMRLCPAVLSSSPTLLAELEPLVGADRLQAFTKATGIDPQRTTEVWIAGYEGGRLTLLRGGDEEKVTQTFIAHASSELTTTSADGVVTQISAVVAGRPEALLRVKGHFIAIAAGDVGLLDVVRALATSERAAPAALFHEGEFAGSLPGSESSEVHLFARGPFPEAQDLLVMSTTSARATVGLDGGQLRVSVVARFAYPEPDLGDEVGARVEAALASPEARALGFSRPMDGPVVHCEAGSLAVCSLDVRFQLADVVQGVHRVAAAELDELFR